MGRVGAWFRELTGVAERDRMREALLEAQAEVAARRQQCDDFSEAAAQSAVLAQQAEETSRHLVDRALETFGSFNKLQQTVNALASKVASPSVSPLDVDEQAIRMEVLRAELRALNSAEEERLRPAPEPVVVVAVPKIPCTCGSVHFTAGGQVASPRVDGRCEPSGAILSCVRCGRRWAHCGGELVEPSMKSMPPAWAAQDLHERIQAEQGGSGGSADLGQLRGASRRASSALKAPPRR